MSEGASETDPSPRRDPAEPITEAERLRERELARRLMEAARPDGLLRFDRFVEMALYEPGVGFYAEPGAGLGPGGSFYTAAHATSLFGRTIADRIAAEFERLGRPTGFTVVEAGCGDGSLSVDAIRGLHERLGAEASIRYVLVERSPSLRSRAADRVAELGAMPGIEVRLGESVGSDGPFVGVVVANELLDALPFRRLVRRSGAWRELLVRVRPDGLDWLEGEAEADPPAEELGPADEGVLAELSRPSEEFVREIADHLVEGAALILDYGSEAGPLIHDHPRGTLSAVRHHRPMPDPLAHPGLVDLSALVNFSRVRAAARASGLGERAFRSQAEALVAWGLEARTEAAVNAAEGEEEAVRIRLSVKNLLFGFSNFMVLELEAGSVERPDSRAA